MFVECSGQWRMFPASGFQKRLYYQALERQTVISIIKDIFCIPEPERPDLLTEVRMIEQGALEALNNG